MNINISLEKKVQRVTSNLNSYNGDSIEVIKLLAIYSISQIIMTT